MKFRGNMKKLHANFFLEIYFRLINKNKGKKQIYCKKKCQIFIQWRNKEQDCTSKRFFRDEGMSYAVNLSKMSDCEGTNQCNCDHETISIFTLTFRKIANNQLKSQKQRNVYLSNQLRQQNMLLATLKNHNRQLEQSFVQEIPLKGSNVMDMLYKQNEFRDKQNKNVKKSLSQSYHEEDNVILFILTRQLQKQHSLHSKHKEMNQDIKHLETLQQIQAMRKKQYEEIKNKHSPEPKIGDIHKRMQEVNEQYKKSLQSFAYNGKDILDSLKRDDTKQIIQKNKRVQSQLKYQMQEKKVKQSIQKHQYMGEVSNLQKSILGPLFSKDSNFDKRQYGSYLMKQINQSDLRKSTDKMRNKEKVEVGSIFGGQCGPQRLKMIKYIDKKMGIQSDYIKQIDTILPKSTTTTLYRGNKNFPEFNNIQTSPTTITSSIKLDDRTIEIKKKDMPQKKPTQQNGSNEYRQRKKTQSLSVGIGEQTTRLSLSRVGQQSATPKSYLGYDLIKGTTMRYQY